MYRNLLAISSIIYLAFSCGSEKKGETENSTFPDSLNQIPLDPNEKALDKNDEKIISDENSAAEEMDQTDQSKNPASDPPSNDEELTPCHQTRSCPPKNETAPHQGARILYDGEQVPFGDAWQISNSQIDESSQSPYSGHHHLQLHLTLEDTWAGVGYSPSFWLPENWQPYSHLRFQAKSQNHTTLRIQLSDSSNPAVKDYIIYLNSIYQEYIIPLSALSHGIDIKEITSINFTMIEENTDTYIIDIDNIILDIAP